MAGKPIKISQLNKYIGRTLSVDPILSDINVIGEVSNLNMHSSGHAYFTLKEENSKINCFLASSNLKHIRYELENGMELICSGYISVYEKGGYYSLNVVDVKPSGEGDLSIAYNKLKDKLEKEGLFSKEHKKPIPSFPKTVMIITSPTGAAIRDAHKIIESKNNYVDIITMPAIVQGEHAAGDIAKAIKEANRNHKYVDVIILGRGGGSIEDLWAFNEEVVIRAVFESEIPIISAVGHETDTTLCDFVADVRAETPTAAANMSVPDLTDIKDRISYFKERLNLGVKRNIDKQEQRLKIYNLEALNREILREIKIYEITLNSLMSEISREVDLKIKERQQLLAQVKINLDSLNPNRVLTRGYGIVKDENGVVISSVDHVRANQPITIFLKDGAFEAKTIAIKKEK